MTADRTIKSYQNAVDKGRRIGAASSPLQILRILYPYFEDGRIINPSVAAERDRRYLEGLIKGCVERNVKVKP